MIRSFPLTLLALIAAPLALAACSGPAASDVAAIPVQIKDHVFAPAEIEVKANQPAVLAVTNADGVAEEFDSDGLKVEKVIAGGQKGLIRLRPLPPGRYTFMGEYHSKTAQGVVVAK
ncbi:MAG: cupredoxin domain-containing protein [Pseudomonadota bacterium]|nr:cupredoxin domain-containing protein [Pseudomonadota bacterium]